MVFLKEPVIYQSLLDVVVSLQPANIASCVALIRYENQVQSETFWNLLPLDSKELFICPAIETFLLLSFRGGDKKDLEKEKRPPASQSQSD